MLQTKDQINPAYTCWEILGKNFTHKQLLNVLTNRKETYIGPEMWEHGITHPDNASDQISNQSHIHKLRNPLTNIFRTENQLMSWKTGSRHMTDLKMEDIVWIILIMLKTKYQINLAYTSWEIIWQKLMDVCKRVKVNGLKAGA